MGSHAGATAEGQKQHLAQFGICEEYLGVPVISTMETVQVDQLPDGMPVYCDKAAYEADGIILFNKIKPHTHFKAPHESGLLKMICIGVGKHRGASAFHSLGYDHFGENLERVSEAFLKKVRVFFSVGLTQSPSDHIGHLEVIPTPRLFEEDARLQQLARAEMPHLLLPRIDVLVIDSVAALIPRVELEGEVGDTVVGALARLMSQAMRRLAGAISKNNCTVIFINQLRQKIGVMYGNPETTPGGLALKYYASVRIDVRRIETLKNGTEMIGNRTRAKVVKNKVAPPFREAEFDIMYGEGISKIGEIVDLGVKLEIIDKAGAWFTVDGQRVQGRDAVKEYLRNNPEVCDKIEQEIRANSFKLMSPQARKAAQVSGRAVDITASDFDEG